jgi:hypothetical protein
LSGIITVGDSSAVVTEAIMDGVNKFSKNLEAASKFRCLKGDMKHVPH